MKLLCYDGAGVVSGHVNGLLALILRENSKALFTPCASHKFNLATGTSWQISGVWNLNVYYYGHLIL